MTIGPERAQDSFAADYPLPGFVKRRDSGIFVELSALDSNALMYGFVERLFSTGFRFVAGDYAMLQQLLFVLEPVEIGRWAQRLESTGKATEALLARDIVAFDHGRRQLYRGWRTSDDGRTTEYLFEPVYVERTLEESVYREADETGETPVLRVERRTVSEAAKLDRDEFFAAAWLSGVRFGWEIPRIDAELARDAAGVKNIVKLVVASYSPPTSGTDATLIEVTQALHRNDAPRALRDGRVDLTQFSNRFPQVTKNARLLKKLPRSLGAPGHAVTGAVLEPDMPLDFALEDLAGANTCVQRHGGADYIVAVMDGFLNIDARTNLISVTEKIVNREGVSVRTTGNLQLQGDEFEEHGEVQERRTVEGYNMTFMADVFGHVVSRGGHITLKQHLAGGSAKSDGGRIEVAGGASRALVEAHGGEIHIKFAESCTIIGSRIRIERACLCDIVGDDVHIDRAEGCAVAGLRIMVGNAAARKQIETALTLPLPDPAAYERQTGEAKKLAAELAEQMRALAIRREQLSETPELKTFLMVQKKKNAGEIEMSAQQELQFATLARKVAPIVKKIGEIRTAIQSLRQRHEEAEQSLAAVHAQRDAHLSALSCTIEAVTGDTVVRTRLRQNDEPALEHLSQRDLRIRLRERAAGTKVLFSASSGAFSWVWTQ